MAAAVLVVLPGGFMPPRLLAVPAGTRLPTGMRSVVAVPVAAAAGSCRGVVARAVPVPASAVAGSGRGGATCLALLHASGLPASPFAGSGRSGARRSVAVNAAPPDAGNTTDKDQDGDRVYKVIEVHGPRALDLLAIIEPPEALVGKAEALKSELEGVVDAAKARGPDKMPCVLGFLQAISGIVNLVFESAPKTPGKAEYVPLKICPGTRPERKVMIKHGEDTVHTYDFGGHDADAMMIQSMIVIFGFAIGMTTTHIWDTPGGKEKILPFWPAGEDFW